MVVSYSSPENRNEAVVSIGVLRPDGTKEYPLYMQRIKLPPLTGRIGATYTTKMQGWHKAFAQIFIYTNSTVIENEVVPLQNFFVGPSIGIVIPTPLPAT